MSIYDLDTIVFTNNNLPPDKRMQNISLLAYSLLSALQYNIDNYETYRTGDVYSYWDRLASYSIGDVVTFQGKNYMSIQNSNVGRLPVDTIWWVLVNGSSIAADERIRYQPNRLIFEYALNRWFGTAFRQPPLQSDIYIEDTSFYNPSFIVGGIESNSSITYLDRSTGYVFNDYFVQLPYSFSVNIPTAAYADLGGGDAVLYEFINKITAAGKTATIVVLP
jgi:hypothetical protein